MRTKFTEALTETRQFRRAWRLLTALAVALAAAALAVALTGALLAARLYRTAADLQRTMTAVRRAAQLYLDQNARKTPQD